ncbi:MAG: tRNA preQ1(34) S-adenosylmethionine ribosyltransferase-isomerase QueA [Nitrosomonadales bacterium]|nr:MAG: tRNA preQ1(34) S-adenosylmethionine ribosyltransferase-isomerase QueA [Nitrosomonadales bacterium]
MHTSDFDFELPEELVAQLPARHRSASRLLWLDGASGAMRDALFVNLPSFLAAGDLLVFNDTRVIKARLSGRKESGGKVEVLIERILGEQQALAHIRASHAPKPGGRLMLADAIEVEVLQRQGDLTLLRFLGAKPVAALLEKHGALPLPPYITHAPGSLDEERYQTIYAREAGAVAAPTAGLHFDAPMLEALREKGVDTAFVTLHVGAGTFQPVRVDRIAQHQMHSERYSVPESTVAAIHAARARGGKVTAVGTTALRALESAARGGELQAGSGETDIFITPGYRFNVAERLLTNFHLPRSTLLMLVAAFAGLDNIRRAYQHAIEQHYRFFSYGDAMLIERRDAD